MTGSKRHIVVIGAGVTGLQTACSLLEAGYRVTVVAKHFPGDRSIEYTSPWAGGQWRSHATEDDKEQQQWDIETYNHWLSILASELNEPDTAMQSGLGIYDSVFYSYDDDYPWYATDVLSFKQLSGALIPKGMKQGQKYSSIMINVPQYLDYLLSTVESLGGTTIRAVLPSSTSLLGTLNAAREVLKGQIESDEISAFVNATGISSRHLVPDPKVFPVRGQTVTVAGSAKKITTVKHPPKDGNEHITYVLPRPNTKTTVLGGTKQARDWTAEVDAKTTEAILQRAKEFAPELLDERGEFNIVSEQVGLRPGRKGGARVEIEEIGSYLVCHAYGHGGAGYQNSIGSANKAVRLLDERLKDSGIGGYRL